MDDYLTKPIKRDAVAAAIGRWLQASAQVDSTAGAPVPSVAVSAHDLFDEAVFNQLASIMGEDMANLVDSYLADTPAQLAAVTAALNEGDLTTAMRAAHSLKASSATLGVTALETLARDLEAHARAAASVEEAHRKIETLRRTFESVRPLLLTS